MFQWAHTCEILTRVWGMYYPVPHLHSPWYSGRDPAQTGQVYNLKSVQPLWWIPMNCFVKEILWYQWMFPWKCRGKARQNLFSCTRYLCGGKIQKLSCSQFILAEWATVRIFSKRRVLVNLELFCSKSPLGAPMDLKKIPVCKANYTGTNSSHVSYCIFICTYVSR